MKGIHIPIEDATNSNSNFRHVLYTGTHSQLVLMSIPPQDEIGLETHPDNDQFFRFESGEGEVLIDGTEYLIKNGDAVIVPAGAQHNIINTSQSEDLKLYTIYSPAHHKDGIIRTTKKEAQENEAEFDGVTSE